MTEYPRPTAFTKKRSAAILAAYEVALADQAIAARIADYLAAVEEVASAADDDEVASVTLLAAEIALVRTVRADAPELSRILGNRLLPFISRVAVYHALRGADPRGDEREIARQVALHWPLKTERLFAHNPLTATPDGSINIPPGAAGQADLPQFAREIRDYQRSCRAEGKAGRPVKLNKDQCLRAAALYQSGAKWPAIARAEGIDFDPYDKRSRDRTRKAVYRLVERGNLLKLLK